MTQRDTAEAHGSGIDIRDLTGDSRLPVDEFADRHGAAFLLTTTQMQDPRGPASTAVELGDPDERSECTAALATFVYPIQQTGRSVGHLVTLGRAGNNDVVIRDRSVSRFHAFVKQPDTARFQIMDAGSSNGTVVNGHSVPAQGHGEPVELKSGDNVRIGQVEFTYVSAESLQEYLRTLQS